MSKLHFVTFSLFLVIESTISLPPSVSRRQFTGLDSKTDRFVSPVFPKETTPDSVDRMSEKCLKAFSGLDAFSVFQYIDAIGKPPSGLTAGNVLWLGSYDVCKNISDAQYCLAFGVDYEITAMQSLPISWGLCAPLACNKTDIPLFVNELIEVFLPTLRIKWGKYSSLHCAHPSKWTTGPIITLVICGIIAYLCLVGTLVDLCLIQQTWKFWFTLENVRNESHLPSKERQDWGDANNEYTPLVHSNVPDSKSELVSDVHLIQPSVQERGFFVRFLLCFSITRNTSKIMDCSVPPGAITSVNGVRVLSLWWIILGHTYSAIVTSGILNDILLGLNIVHRFTFGTISNAFFAVDSFFVLSGLLVAYLSFRRMEQNDGKLPLFKFYFHRFWRLTPSYMFVILFYSNLYAFLGEGPYWFSSQNSTLCEKYWWTNLLYINNFYPTNSGNQCLGWSWYLANDMQFYIISPLVIFLVKRFKWKGVFASVGGLLGISFVVTAVIIDYYELKVILFGRGGGEPHLKQNGAENNFSDLLYIKPYCRISPYLVGMVLGYLIHAEESAHRLSPLRKIPRQIVCLVGWFVATGLGVAVVYGIYPSTKKGGTPFNKAENITYGSFSRFTWGLALAWVIYACNKGYGSLVNKFLSASYWIPLSRLTYSAYLLHVIVLQAFFASFHHTTEYTDELWAFYFVAGVAMTYAAAFVLTVCVEFPVMQLENTFFFRNKK